MGLDLGWLTSEAQRLHSYFESLFYALVSALLVLGVLLEYFKLPLGGMPAFAVLVGRAAVAVLLLSTYSEVSNILGRLADDISSGIGGFDSINTVLKRMGEKVESHSGNWLSAKTLIITVLSILTYTFLFYSVVIAEAAHVFTWTLLYVFSPLVIALYVLPQTSPATKALYRSLIEVCFWKICWCVIAALLWASVLSDLSSTSAIDFVKLICINLMLGASLLATPWVVHAMATSGLSGFTRSFSGIATAAGFMTPIKALSVARRSTSSVGRGVKSVYQRIRPKEENDRRARRNMNRGKS